MHRRNSLFALSLIVVLARAGFAESPWPVERRPASSPAAFTYTPECVRAAPAEYLRDAIACFLYSGTEQTLEADGTLVSTTHEVIRLNTRKGVEQLGEYRSITFNPSYEKATLHQARVYKANGGTVEVAARHVQVRDVNTDHQVYDPSKQVVISFPTLDVGDVIDVSWTVRGRHPEFRNHFVYRYSFGNDKYPVVRDEWTVRLPKDRPFQFAAINGDVPRTETDDGVWKTYRWRATNCPAPASGDHQPPNDERDLQVACTTFPSWPAVHEWEKQTLAGRTDCPPVGKALVAELTRGLSDPEAKARALTQWIRTHIRYLSHGEKHDYTPNPPSRTLGDLCGDCKDVAHLLAILMREAGLKAGVATLGPRGDGQVIESLPSPWGTHAMTVVTIGGKDHWVDTTAPRLGWDVLPRDDRDRVCFITDPTSIRLARTPKSNPADARSESVTTLTIASNGDATAERETRYFGLSAWQKRDDWADIPAADRRSAIAAELQDAFPHAKLVKLAIEGLENTDAPLVVRSEFTVPELFDPVTLEGRLGDYAQWAAVLTASANSERTAPLEVGDPFDSVSRYILNLPPLYRLSALPEGHEATSRWGKISVKPKKSDDPRRCEFETRVVLANPRVAPADFEIWRDFQDVVQATFRVDVSLKTTHDPADIVALEEVCSKLPDDARSAAALAEIYIGQKKFDDARRVLARAREATPSERRLWVLSLATADELGDEERLYRAMLKQFPEDAKVILDLSQNLLEQERPDAAKKLLEPLARSQDAEIKAEALINLAQCSLAVDEAKRALQQLRAAQQAHAESFTADVWFLKGQAHEAAGESKFAIDAYRRAVEDEDAPDAYAALVRLHLNAGSRDDAVNCWRRLAVAAGDDAEWLAQAADLAAKLGRFDDAMDLGLRAKEGDSGLHPMALRPVGLAFYHRQDFASAVQYLSKAEVDADSLSALVRALVALGRLKDAQVAAARFEAVEPTKESKQTAAWMRDVLTRHDRMMAGLPAGFDDRCRVALDRIACADALYRAGLWSDRVEQLIREAVEAGGSIPSSMGHSPMARALALRGLIALSRGRLLLAGGEAEKAIELNPDESYAYRVRGRVRLERGQAGGLDDLERAAKLTDRHDAGVLHDLAYGYFVSGRKIDALTTQREAAKLDPDDRTVAQQLSEFQSAK